MFENAKCMATAFAERGFEVDYCEKEYLSDEERSNV